jgi:DNA polymerase III alpha subunit (gram-positive type)
MGTKNLVHLNGHIMCAIDVETTGLQAGYHELLQVCFLPLNAQLVPRDDLPVFDVKIKPLRPDRIDQKAASVNKIQMSDIIRTGYEPDVAFALFEHWYDRLPLPERKRIIPLAKNWPFDRAFLIEWMGWENFNHRIDGRARDAQVVACYMQDHADFQGEQIPFANGIRLTSLAAELGIEVIHEATHDALYDCMLTAKVYREFCKEEFLG